MDVTVQERGVFVWVLIGVVGVAGVGMVMSDARPYCRLLTPHQR